MGSPLFGAGHGDYLSPVLQIGDNFEGLGYLTAAIAVEDFADLSVDLLDFGVVQRLFVHFLQFLLQQGVPIIGVRPTGPGQSEKTQQIHLGVSSVGLVL